MKKLLPLVVGLVFTTQVYALSCETELAKFDFTDGSPTNFYIGTPEDVDRAYQQLKESIGAVDAYSKTTVFYSRGYTRISRYSCPGEKCSGADILKGFQQCSAGGMSKADACYPLAVAYKAKLYCLLNPGQDKLDMSKPFKPYVPFRN